jgi:hypothetical protein
MNFLKREIENNVIKDISPIIMSYYYIPTKDIIRHCEIGNYIAVEILEELSLIDDYKKCLISACN